MGRATRQALQVYQQQNEYQRKRGFAAECIWGHGDKAYGKG